MGKTKFQDSWEKVHPWLVSVKTDVYKAKCTACNKILNVESGVGIIKQHEARQSHKDKVNNLGCQLSFISDNSGKLMSDNGNRIQKNLSCEEQRWNAETLRALNVVQKNHSFSLCDEDSDLYKRMFPDSKIAKAYSKKN